MAKVKIYFFSILSAVIFGFLFWFVLHYLGLHRTIHSLESELQTAMNNVATLSVSNTSLQTQNKTLRADCENSMAALRSVIDLKEKEIQELQAITIFVPNSSQVVTQTQGEFVCTVIQEEVHEDPILNRLSSPRD